MGLKDRPWLAEKMTEDRFLRRYNYVIRERPNKGPVMWSLGMRGRKVTQEEAIKAIVAILSALAK